jgi:hypothetical protein
MKAGWVGVMNSNVSGETSNARRPRVYLAGPGRCLAFRRGPGASFVGSDDERAQRIYEGSLELI